jgi:hypothetical protein
LKEGVIAMKTAWICVLVILLFSLPAIALAGDIVSHTVMIRITHESHMTCTVKNSEHLQMHGSVDPVKDEDGELKSCLNWHTNQPGKKISVSVEKYAGRDKNIIISTSTATGSYQRGCQIKGIASRDSGKDLPVFIYTMTDDF